MKLITLAVLILLTAIPITTTAQEIPEAAAAPRPTPAEQETPAAEPSVIRVGDNPDQIIRFAPECVTPPSSSFRAGRTFSIS